ncbi:MAG: YfhO family protein [Bacteroidota bacterium]|nr:YfhO family protein [Bacteroidota bacterium]
MPGLYCMFRKFVGKCFPHLVAFFIFLVAAVLYCRPVFENKVLYQEDVVQWQAMAHNSFAYKAAHGHFPLWTNSMFSGMPAYMIAMDARAPVLGATFYDLLTLHLKKPAGFFFLACLCLYFLCLVLKINPYIGIIGGLAYSYATYNPVIVAAGHDTKMQCIALIPALIGSLILIYEKKYWQGAALTALFTAVMISINHVQIIYYCLIVAVIMTVGYAIRWVRSRDYRHLLMALAIAAGSALTGILSNAVTLFTTYDASRETTRGGSDLSATSPGDYTENGFGTNLAFAFSMYRTEIFVLWVPEMFGGSTNPDVPARDSRAARLLHKMPADLAGSLREDLSYYWGGLGNMVGGPPYAGAIICLLAVLGFFLLDGRHKWWILGGLVLCILMSWGSYFSAFNGFLLKFLPMYNKFRAPSMIIVMPVFLLVLLAVLTLQKIVGADKVPSLWEKTALWARYKQGILLTAGVFVLLLWICSHADYSAAGDSRIMQVAGTPRPAASGQASDFIHALREDRHSIFFNSLVRSLAFTAIGALLIGLQIRRRLRPALFLAALGLLCFVDVMDMDLHYLNHRQYQEQATYSANFSPTPADRQILLDTGYYRVFDLRDSGLNTLSYGAMTAYFHHSIGGYHAAKLKIYEDLIDRQLYNFPDCRPVIDMLNTKYIIWPTRSGPDSVELNRHALGPAWFVNDLRFEDSAGQVMNALTRLRPHDTAVLFGSDRSQIAKGIAGMAALADPAAPAMVATLAAYRPGMASDFSKPGKADSIRLVKNDNDEITYLSESGSPRFAVFSEVFYSRGWRAWIDEREVPIFRTNYVLRGLVVPSGHHVIRFVFHPQSYYLGRQVQWMASLILLLLLFGAILATAQDAGLFRGPPYL